MQYAGACFIQIFGMSRSRALPACLCLRAVPSPPSLACVPMPARSFAEELLRLLAEEGNGYTKICFSNKSFGLDAARVAERILMKVQSNLTDVDLSDFIAGRGEDEAL